MTNLMPHTTTSTELQRNYKNVVNRARKLKQPIVILANNKPQGVYMDYDLFDSQNDLLVKDQGTISYSPRKRKSLEDLYGSWTKSEAEEFDQIIQENFEQINLED